VDFYEGPNVLGYSQDLKKKKTLKQELALMLTENTVQ